MDNRKLEELISGGKAIRVDLELLGVRTVTELARHEPDSLYRRLCRKTAKAQDICVLDTFRAAVAQARNPKLPVEQSQWWYWSRKRKASAGLR